MIRLPSRVARGIAASLAVVSAGSARADIHRAVDEYKAGHYLESAAELQAIVDRSPGYAYGYFLLGHCMLKMQRPGDAEHQFRRAVELNPARPEYFQGLALALKAEADWAKSIQAASDGLLRVTDPGARYTLLALRGYAWGSLERWSEAARDLEAARKIRTESWVLVLLGKAYFALHDYDRAVVPLREALDASPEDPDVLRLIIESFLLRATAEADPSRKRVLYVEALSYAQRLAGVRSDDTDAIYLVGRAALGAGQLLQAETVFQHVLSREPRQCYAMVNLGRTYIALERYTEAEAFLRKAAACAPRLAAIYETLGDLYMRRGLPQQAADAYRRAEEIEPRQRTLPPTIFVGNPR